MTYESVLLIIGSFVAIIVIFSTIFSLLFIIFPFFQSLTTEKRFERYVDDQCLQGNEIAILLRRNKTRFYDTDFKLMRAAIEGNEHAIRALKLDPETRKNPYH